MYQYYTGIADSVGNLSSNTYQSFRLVSGKGSPEKYLLPDGKIGGLQEKAANLINKTKDNAKIERIKDALINIIGHNRTSGDPVSYTHLIVHRHWRVSISFYMERLLYIRDRKLV